MTVTHPSAARIPCIAREAYTPDQAALANGRDMYNVTRMLLNHPDFYRVFVPYLDKLMSRSLLPPREREVLLLRTLALCEGSYEADHHVRIARSLGMSADLVEAVQAGEGAALGALDRTLVRAAEELVNERCLSEETWNALAKTYGIAQLIEVVFTVGAFTMLSMATNSFGMPLDGTGQP